MAALALTVVWLLTALLAGCAGSAPPGAPATTPTPPSPPPAAGTTAPSPSSPPQAITAAPPGSSAPSRAPSASAAAPAAPASPVSAADPVAAAAIRPDWPAAPAAGPFSAAERQRRRRRYLESGLHQMRRLEQIETRLDTQRLGAGALTAAALGQTGGPGPAGSVAGGEAGEAERWTTQLLEECGGHWERVACTRAELALQRIVIAFPRALPPALLDRARAAATAAGAPPSAAAAAAPWSFADTENQRAVLIARSLVAAVVAGSPDSAAARAWSAYAAAFLAAHDRDGWYEAESPGYLAISITAVLHLADLAPTPEVRELARRELDLLLAAWVQQQAGGYPAGPRSRTYVQWALGDRTTPWRSWAWLAAAAGDAGRLAFSDWPELALAGYEVPYPIALLLRDRSSQPPYEIRTRRRITLAKRMSLDAALYAYATPDYIVGVAQAVGDLRLAVSGGQEIVATLYPEGPDFAPLYLWSRARNTVAERWRSFASRDLAAGAGPAALALLGAGEAEPAGHAFLAAAWSRPEPAAAAEDTLVARCGSTYVALITAGGWTVAPAAQRLPEFYGPGYADAWVAVPRRQPAAIGLLVGRTAEDGDFAAWRRRAAAARLGRSGARLELTQGGRGPAFSYVPGEWAEAGGMPLRPGAYPPLAAPFLASAEPGAWVLSFAGMRWRFAPLSPIGSRR